jgi:hypothetical protein
MNPEMSNLRRIRDVNWVEIEALEAELLQQLSPEEGIRQFAELYESFEWQMKQTDHLFGDEHGQQMIEIQRRLDRIQTFRNKSMDKLIGSVIAIQKHLEENGVDSVLIGGLAIGAWGEPRTTRDVDLKVLLRRSEAQRLLDILGTDFTPIRPNPLQALKGDGILFVQNKLDIRIDLMLADTDFDLSTIRRGRQIELAPGQTVRVCSPEDLLVYKLLAPRGRDYDDVVNIIQRQGDNLDDAYITQWLKEFEKALDDSNLVRDYQNLRQQKSTRHIG